MPFDSVRSMHQADLLYKRYGRPLEIEHTGKYVATADSGQFVLGNTRLEVARQARTNLWSGSYIFKVRERIVGRWR